jgi:hypothetical protein
MSEQTNERLPHKAVYTSLEEAKAVTPPSEKFRVFTISHNGTDRYAWGHTGDTALAIVAREDGYSAEVAEPKAGGPVTKEKVAARLAEFTDEDLKELGLSRRKAR